MQYDPKTRRLETDDGKLIKKIYCPLAKKWEQLMPWTADWSQRLAEYEAGEGGEYGSETETLQTPPLKKYCGSCQKCVLDANSFTEAQIQAVVQVNPEVCLHLTNDHPELTINGGAIPEDNRECGYNGTTLKGLPIVQTARSLAAIEDGVKRGYRLVRPIMESSPDIGRSFSLAYSPLHEKVWVGMDYLASYRYWKDDKGAVSINFTHNRDKHFSPLALYLVPADLQPGQVVHVADVIEDIVHTRYSTRAGSGTSRLKSANAIWTGESLDIDRSRVVDVVG